MPATFTAAVAQAAAQGIANIQINWNLEAKVVNIMVLQVDQNNNSVAPQVFNVSDATFFTDYQAAAGAGPRQKVYNLVLTLMGQSANATVT